MNDDERGEIEEEEREMSDVIFFMIVGLPMVVEGIEGETDGIVDYGVIDGEGE